MDKIEKLLVLNKNVFSTQDLSIIWGISVKKKLWEIIKYYVRKNKLYRIYRGIYSLDKKYSQFELAQKIQPISYISLHTALSIHGINFQYYSTFYSISLVSKKYLIADIEYSYHQVKDYIFYNKRGIVNKGLYFIANKQRAICDTLYMWPNMTFDHVDPLDTDTLLEIAKMYKNKRLVHDIALFIKKLV